MRNQRDDLAGEGAALYAETAALTAVAEGLHETSLQSDRQWSSRLAQLELQAQAELNTQAVNLHLAQQQLANRERELRE